MFAICRPAGVGTVAAGVFGSSKRPFLLVRSELGCTVADACQAPHSCRQCALLLLEEGHCFRDQALALCDMSPSIPREVMEGSNLLTLVQMVSAGMGVTLIPEMAVGIETRASKVSVARLSRSRTAPHSGPGVA